MNNDSWIALIIASALTVLVAIPLYYSGGHIETRGKLVEGSDTKGKEPMQRMKNKAESNFSEG